MELTRRDALAALAASGVAVGTGAVVGTDSDGGLRNPFAETPSPEDRMATLLAVAGVVYPSAVTGVEEFVRTYALGRTKDRADYREGMVEALSTLDEYARTWHGADFRGLDAETRESVLDQMGADTADPDPEGSDPARVRYYLVNELLYALYTSPTGGRLVGIENPQGHPGGTGSYRRGPNADGGGE
ncbi:gluconate 2-dehydrogenase subunit 3 family protein [Halorussus sp. MSC15.2]|uniref:gluconate 2-dehydrogenase subunit 3 family protein n=1 Tax=Halorussus sp. MSC15.2 TaxID=2283638 RepID=UPI0013D17473|nr:gluconate 2-dehydrogenase subunit 3 family protein [Halorussus sp. MSC15.2]NEU59019.1 gluconate 2-dehydrogenase subunit 3 family protein [Halorussus sp. MSC15.2]